LSSDSYRSYTEAVPVVFGSSITYGQIHKVYGKELTDERRYSPAKVTGIKVYPVIGQPDYEHISTSGPASISRTVDSLVASFDFIA